jgi:hypothetical protein
MRESSSCDHNILPESQQPQSVPARQGSSRGEVRKNGNWSDLQLHRAKRAVDRGARITSAADFYGIPRSTLRSHVQGITLGRKRGKTSVLTPSEEKKLVTYLHDMANRGFPLTWLQLKLKVASLVQDGRETPFKDGVPGNGWVRWFRKRHPEVSLRSAQTLEMARARSLCPENVASFYNNLQEAYTEHEYDPSHIWNADESGAQARRSGGGRVLAKTGARSVHIITPNEREHISVLSCINAAGDSIPNYYVFKGKQYQRAYIAKCEVGARMAMQKNAWMTGHLFEKWLTHFAEHLEKKGGLSPTNRHLLILDGHNSHVTIEVIEKAWTLGIDMISLPSHTSHALQPLDVSCFKSFKQAFRICRDIWTMNNRGHGAKKDILAEWVSLGLKKALTTANIKSGFKATGIYPLNPHACDRNFGPSEAFSAAAANDTIDSGSSSDDERNLLQGGALGNERADPAEDDQDIEEDQNIDDDEDVNDDQDDEDVDDDQVEGGIRSQAELDLDWGGSGVGHQSDVMSSQEHPSTLIDQHLQLELLQDKKKDFSPL